MANVKITDMTAGSTPLAGTELFECVQSGNTRKVAASDIAASFSTDAANIIPVANGGSGAATLTGHISGNGTSAFTASPTIPFADLAGRAYASFYSSTNQTGSTAGGTAVQFGSTFVTGAGVTIANDGGGNPTRITMAAAGTYLITVAIHCDNAGAADYDLTAWLRLNGTDIVGSTQVQVIPKTGDGGHGYLRLVHMLTVTAGQYVEMMWLIENASLVLTAVAAVAGPPAYPSQPSANLQVQRIA